MEFTNFEHEPFSGPFKKPFASVFLHENIACKYDAEKYPLKIHGFLYCRDLCYDSDENDVRFIPLTPDKLFTADNQSNCYGVIVVQLVELGRLRSIFIPAKGKETLPPWGSEMFTDQSEPELDQKMLDKMYADMAAELPDWKTQNADPAFWDWLQEFDPVFQRPRKEALDKAYNDRDGRHIVRIFKAYRSYREGIAALDKVVRLEANIEELQEKIEELEQQNCVVGGLTERDCECYGDDIVDLVRRGAQEALLSNNVLIELTRLKADCQYLKDALLDCQDELATLKGERDA